MNRRRRILPVLLGAIGCAALAVPFSPSAQEVDDRPVYYVMLKSLEDGFQVYNIALAADLNRRASRLKARYESERLSVAEAFESLQARQARHDSVFKSERETLNERIATVNEQIALRAGRSNEESRIERDDSPRYANDPRIKSLEERIAARLAEIDAVRSDYLVQASATQEARAALTRQIEEYRNAGDPLTLEIRSLDEDWQRFADAERRKLKQMTDAYGVDYRAYDEWLQAGRAMLEDLRATVAGALERSREQRALHAETDTALRGLIDEYNALVEVHNKARVGDPQRDARAMKFAALEKRIAELQAALTQAREAVLDINEELTQTNQKLTERYEYFSLEKRKRDTTLAAARADLDAARLTAEATIDARRQTVNAQIKILEAHISAELRDARNTLETFSTHLVESCGRNHEGFDTAITRILESNDDGLLYTASGVPRFDMSRPLTASVYTAAEGLEADRHKIDARIVAIEESGRSANENLAEALERDQAVLSAERQRLLEAYAASARQIETRSAALEKRRRAIGARFERERASLGALYTARASLTRAEMQAVQRVLVSAATGLPDTQSGDGDHAQLLDALREHAARMQTPVDASLLAPHALMDRIASQLPNAGSGARSHDWQAFVSRKVTASRKLGGADKAALASAWLARIGRQPSFAAIAGELDASGAVMAGRQALANLFMAGVIDHTSITEQRLDDGGIGIQVSILGRAYQLAADGSLEALPNG
jgi:chromosome segregation ATPase